MADNHTPEVRSYNMSRIQGKNTKPEDLVRRYLFSRGLRYRKNDKRYCGKPDVILPKYKTAIFVNGCFWHSHENCPYFVMPKSRLDYWKPKLERNRIRDVENIKFLEGEGWRVIVVWECEIKPKVRQTRLEKLYIEITEG
jgi:DNA mismatch endonuclease (patch repair protein)